MRYCVKFQITEPLIKYIKMNLVLKCSLTLILLIATIVDFNLFYWLRKSITDIGNEMLVNHQDL